MSEKPHSMPKEQGRENVLDVLREGYMYVSNHSQGHHSDTFEATILGKKAVFITGEEAGELFYDVTKIKRNGAAPEPAQATLLGDSGVQTKDGAEHRNRKQYFLDLMTGERIDEWGQLVRKYYRKAAKKWEQQEQVNLYEESKVVLTQAVCEWAGVPLHELDVENRTDQLTSMFENILNAKHLKSRRDRKKSEEWCEELIRAVRLGVLNPEEETALYQIAWHKDVNGELLALNPAAQDLLNILRPSTAIAVFIAFEALSLHQFPEIVEKLKTSDEEYYGYFVQEVRRYYPFFPFNAGIARTDFEWNGYAFEEGMMVIFDFYGTCHDERLWDQPSQFRPERFEEWEISPTEQIQYKLVAQGGGDYLEGHRCPGEWNTVEAMKVFADFMVNEITFDVPEDQDLSYSLVRMPMRVESGFIMENVKYVGDN